MSSWSLTFNSWNSVTAHYHFEGCSCSKYVANKWITRICTATDRTLQKLRMTRMTLTVDHKMLSDTSYPHGWDLCYIRESSQIDTESTSGHCDFWPGNATKRIVTSWDVSAPHLKRQEFRMTRVSITFDRKTWKWCTAHQPSWLLFVPNMKLISVIGRELRSINLNDPCDLNLSFMDLKTTMRQTFNMDVWYKFYEDMIIIWR